MPPTGTGIVQTRDGLAILSFEAVADSYRVLPASGIGTSPFTRTWGSSPARSILFLPDTATDYSVQLLGVGSDTPDIGSTGDSIEIVHGGPFIALAVRHWGIRVTYSGSLTTAQIVATG